VPTEQLRVLLASGAVEGTELAWTDGMPNWAPINTISELTQSQPAVATRAPVAAVPYYAPTGRMPARAVETLQKHAKPTGDVGDWPLDDARVAQFHETIKIRKRVFSAAQLYRGLLFLSIIGAVIFLLVGLFTVGGSGRASARAMATGMFAIFGMTLAFSVLYYFAWRATMRSQRWAPLTMLIIYLFFAALNLLTIAIGAAGGQPGSAIGAIFGIILLIVFAVVSWRAVVAIPEYLKQPAWCQELIVHADL